MNDWHYSSILSIPDERTASCTGWSRLPRSSTRMPASRTSSTMPTVDWTKSRSSSWQAELTSWTATIWFWRDRQDLGRPISRPPSGSRPVASRSRWDTFVCLNCWMNWHWRSSQPMGAIDDSSKSIQKSTYSSSMNGYWPTWRLTRRQSSSRFPSRAIRPSPPSTVLRSTRADGIFD